MLGRARDYPIRGSVYARADTSAQFILFSSICIFEDVIFALNMSLLNTKVHKASIIGLRDKHGEQ